MVAFPLQNIYNHSFQPLWKAKKKNATELPTIMESSTKKKTKQKQKKNKKTKKAMELQEEDQL